MLFVLIFFLWRGMSYISDTEITETQNEGKCFDNRATIVDWETSEQKHANNVIY